jgi:hypothetical protein
MISSMTEKINEMRVQPGYCVSINLLYRSGKREHLEFDLVTDKQSDYQAGFIGISTPFAKAILGEKAGITVPYFTDELLAIEILSIRESTRTAADTAVQRDSAVQDAKDQIEFTNAVLFAASVDTKWGSYDADGLDYEKWKARQAKKAAFDEHDK